MIDDDEELRRRLRTLLAIHEDCRLYPYIDEVGKITIGYGRNLSDRGISQTLADLWLVEDSDTAIAEVRANVRTFSELDLVRQVVLADMAYNLGIDRFLGFRRALSFVGARNYRDAAAELLASKWARQVKGRARRLAQMMRTGAWPAVLAGGRRGT